MSSAYTGTSVPDAHVSSFKGEIRKGTQTVLCRCEYTTPGEQRGRGIGHTMYSPMVFHKNGILSPAPVLLACPDGCCPAKVRMQRAIATVEHCTHGRTCYAQVRPPGHGTAVKIFVFKKKFHCCLVQGHSIEHICCPHPQSEVIQ